VKSSNAGVAIMSRRSIAGRCLTRPAGWCPRPMSSACRTRPARWNPILRPARFAEKCRCACRCARPRLARRRRSPEFADLWGRFATCRAIPCKAGCKPAPRCNLRLNHADVFLPCPRPGPAAGSCVFEGYVFTFRARGQPCARNANWVTCGRET